MNAPVNLVPPTPAGVEVRTAPATCPGCHGPLTYHRYDMDLDAPYVACWPCQRAWGVESWAERDTELDEYMREVVEALP